MDDRRRLNRPLGKVYCVNCRDYKPFSVGVESVHIIKREREFDALEITAYCANCLKAVYVPEINDVNCVIRETEYVKAKEAADD